ncbi:hypothetical protein CSUB01_11440 [Colletotrichum sublineola]|uniref:Uncharacterized protein n=1 Tax=Colletotrichum sublineola TaxID=1173701 RepID=A0A066WT30_COLSU|nr:hypothetical protein CSUB01_11440 [Colletotrichum sublineola]
MPAPSVEDSKRVSEVLTQGQESSAMTSSFSTTGPDKVEAYQTALAAAAFEAAANGRFRRDSSPPPSEIMSPGGESSHSVPHGEDNYGGNYDDNYDDYDDGGFRDDLDDYDVDYDDFIAEANASALANDLDGWYGQEFRFYSAPIKGGRYSRDSSNGLDKKPFKYANGGFFRPLERSKNPRPRLQELVLLYLQPRHRLVGRRQYRGLPHYDYSPAVTIASPYFTHTAAGFDLVPETDEMDEMSISNSISHLGLWMKSPDADVHLNLVPRTDPTTPQQPQQQEQHQ